MTAYNAGCTFCRRRRRTGALYHLRDAPRFRTDGAIRLDMYSCHTDPKKIVAYAARIKMKETFFDTPKLIMTENTPENVTQDDTAIETVDISHGVIVGPSKHRENAKFKGVPERIVRKCQSLRPKPGTTCRKQWNQCRTRTNVHNLGVRAAHLMKVCSDIEAEKTTASTPKSTSILETVMIFMCGVFITHPRLWSICSALFLNRAIAALKMNINLQYSVSIVVGAHVYIVQQENWLIAALHMAAWIITWMWATKNPVL